MSAAKALAYALCDKLESKKVDEVVRNLVSSGWNIREVAWEASSFDHEMPYFDTGRDFDIGFPDTLSSKIEFLTANGSIVQARARLHFKQALIFAKASKHVAALKNSLDYYYGSSVIPPPKPRRLFVENSINMNSRCSLRTNQR